MVIYNAISKALGLQRTTVRAIIHRWRKLVTVVNLPRSGWSTKITPRAQWRLIQEVIKEPCTTSKELQASLTSIKVSVHDSTIRKRLGKNGTHRRVPREKPLLTKKNTKARLTFAKNILIIPKTWETHQRLHLLCAACLTGSATICISQQPFHWRCYCLHPAHCSLPPGK